MIRCVVYGFDGALKEGGTLGGMKDRSSQRRLRLLFSVVGNCSLGWKVNGQTYW